MAVEDGVNRREYARRSLRERAERLVRMIDLDGPTNMLAREAWSVFRAALLLDREAAVACLGETLSTAIFRSGAFCPGRFQRFDCEQSLPPETSHPQHCLPCSKGQDDELRSIGLDPDADPEDLR